MAKALRDFARNNPSLVVKGGMVGTGLLSASDINVLADLPSRDTLLAQFAGGLAAPLQQLAGLIQALPRNLAYGLSALIDQRQAGGRGAGRASCGVSARSRSGTDSRGGGRNRPVTEPEAESAAAEARTGSRGRSGVERRTPKPPGSRGGTDADSTEA